jgi:hypothetical protein
MTNRLMFGLVCIAMSLSAAPCAAGGDPFLGEIDTFAFNFCPPDGPRSTANSSRSVQIPPCFRCWGRLMAAMEKQPSHCRQENRFSR